MFLVAELVWINLCGQTSHAGLQDELDTLPADLDKVDDAYVFRGLILRLALITM